MQGIRHIATPASEGFRSKNFTSNIIIFQIEEENNYTNPPIARLLHLFFQLKAPEGSELRHIYGKTKFIFCPVTQSKISVVPLLASLAFYVQFPPGLSVPVIKKDVLANIVQGSTGWTLELHKCQYIECTNPFCRYNDGNDSCDRSDPDRKRQIQNACHHWWIVLLLLCSSFLSSLPPHLVL